MEMGLFSFDDPVERAVAVAVTAHQAQLDKAGQPYILHVMRVMTAGETRDEQIVGALHDVLEDSGVTSGVLGTFFEPHIVDAVMLVSRYATDSYARFIQGIVDSGNQTAIRVKLHDVVDHLEGPTPCPHSLVERYQAAYRLLKPSRSP